VTCRKCRVRMKELKGHIFHKQRKHAFGAGESLPIFAGSASAAATLATPLHHHDEPDTTLVPSADPSTRASRRCGRPCEQS
jgi:hypothetical protein